MNEQTQAIHRERIEELKKIHADEWEDAEVFMKKISHELWRCFSGVNGGKVDDLILWVHGGRDYVEKARIALQTLEEELDDIEAELK